jgi:hypothetical protein
MVRAEDKGRLKLVARPQRCPRADPENSIPTMIEMIEDFDLEQIANRFCLQ